MRINGNALLARKVIVTRRFGSDAWNQLFRNVAEGLAIFRRPVTASTQIPLSDFLAFHDEMIRRLYGGDLRAYSELGEQSALWALEGGPYRSFIATREWGAFAKSFTRLWHTYFSETESQAEAYLVDDSVELSVSALPIWHPYFEYLVTGYMRGALGLMCVNPIATTRQHGGTAAGYLYRFSPVLPHDLGPDVGSAASNRLSQLSQRQLNVLQLLGQGRTNKQIGAALGISDRTVQIHLTRIYDKLGVSSRVEAALSVAEMSLQGRARALPPTSRF